MADITAQLNQISEMWFNIIALNSLHLVILFILLFPITLVLQKKSSLFLYSLWSLFLLKTVLLPVVKIPVLQRIVIPVIPLNTFVYNSSEILANPGSSHTIHLTIQSILFLIWVIGVIILIALYIRNEHLFFSLLNDSTLYLKQNNVESFAKQLNISKYIEVYISPNVPAPFTKGLRKPVIYLPESAASWNGQQLNHVICHELAHIKRKDILTITFQNIINILYFFHPLVWIANHQINFHREKICDDIAVNILDENPANYGRTLMNNLESFLVNRRLPLIANGLFFSKKTIIKRFEYLLNRGKEISMKLNLFQKVLLSIFAITLMIFSCNNGSDQITFSSVNKNPGVQIEYDELPQPIAGKEAINNKIVYSGKLKSLEGEHPLLVFALVKRNGKVLNCKIEVSSGYNDLDNAVLKAVKSSEFIPAQLNNKDISMPIYISFFFKDGRVRFDNIFANIQKPNPNVKFIPYDTPPEPIGGFKAIRENVIYPKVEKDAGHEGTVVVQAFVDKNGDVSDKTAILQSPGFKGLEEAATNAIKKTKFKPAVQKDKPVGVYITIPVLFKLDNEKLEDSVNRVPMKIEKSQTLGDVQFVLYDSPPKPIGGFKSIQQNILLPLEEQDVNGIAIIQTFIDENGNATQLSVERSCGNEKYDQAAINAIKKTKFIPARKSDKTIGVWTRIPVTVKNY